MILRDLRTARSLSRAALARLVGVSPPMISMIERGRRGVSISLALRLVDALGVADEDRYRVIGELVTEGANYAR